MQKKSNSPKQPLVSVVMPVYNGERYLKEAIESILNQTYKNFEFIIVDDKSTDGSRGVLKEYARKDKRIKLVFNKENKGQSKTVKKGIRISQGEFFLKLDQDDVASQNRIKETVNFLLDHKEYVLVGGGLKIIDEESNVVGCRDYPTTNSEIKKHLFFKSPFAYPAVTIRAKFLKSIKYPDMFQFADDYYMWSKLLSLGKGYNLPDYLTYYRINRQQVKNKSLKAQLKETIEVQKRIFKENQHVPILAKINHLALNLLMFFPANLIIYLFKRLSYKPC